MQIKKDRALHIVSGIAPGLSGTGRLMSYLVAQNKFEKDTKIHFHYAYYPSTNIRTMIASRQFIKAIYSVVRIWFSKRWFACKIYYLSKRLRGKILIFHPQTLGFNRTLQLMRTWGNKAILFGLDNSFFCVRSYNYIPGTSESCLRCIGGNFGAVTELNCLPLPVASARGLSFVKELRTLLGLGQIKVLAQNQQNAELYRRHVGNNINVQTVGLWAQDWDGLSRASEYTQSLVDYDIVYHGDISAAKGGLWLLEVARHLPNVRFLFPISAPLDLDDIPSNIDFKPMSWESGLHQAVINAKIVCVPSLWSATIEGAFIKSIMCARAVACVKVDAIFNAELPEKLVLRLESTPYLAAHQLKEALDTDWVPDSQVHALWVREFKSQNENMLRNIVDAICD